MREAREAPAVILQEYNNLRSKCPGKPVLSFEGFEDTIYYNVMVEKVGIATDYAVLVCRGKDRVLALRKLLARNESEYADLVWYFVDHDFDGLKGQNDGEEIYCTDTYSIENHIAQRESMVKILEGEFRCIGEQGNADSVEALKFFDQVMEQYFLAFYDVNHAIYTLRKLDIDSGKIDNSIDKYISISPEGLHCALTFEDIPKLTGATQSLRTEELFAHMETVKNDFAKVTALTGWRGKFHLAVFQKVLRVLKEDRGRKNGRQIFVSRAVVDTNFDGNLIRSLTSLVKVPEELEAFLKTIGTPKAA